MFEINLIRQGRTEEYKLICPYDEILVGNIKTIPVEQRKFSPVEKTFSLKAVGLYTLMKKYKGNNDILFKFEDDKQKVQFLNIITKHKNRIQAKIDAQKKLEENNRRILEIKANLPELVKNFDYKPFLKAGIVPYDHQVAGAIFSNHLNKSIIAAGLGAGKTLCSIIAAQMNPDIKRVLCIVPSSLQINWQTEIKNFTNEQGYIIKIKNKKVDEKYIKNEGLNIDDCKFLIVSYNYFSSSTFNIKERVEKLKLHCVNAILYDEAHRLGYSDSNQSRNIKNAFEKAVPKQILLSGTIIKNSLKNLYPILKLVKPEEFKNKNDFYTEYCGLRYDLNGWGGWVDDKKATPDLEGLYNKLQTILYRVRTEDVIKNLPAQVVRKVVLEMNDKEKREYKDIEDGLLKINWASDSLTKVGNEDYNSVIVILNRLRQFTAMCKLNYLHDVIKELNEDEDEKCLVFDVYKAPLYNLQQKLGGNTKVFSGDINIEERNDLVVEFQNKESNLKNLLLSMASGSVGLTLTASKTLFVNTTPYLIDDLEQCLARINRISQERINNAFIMVMEDTVDMLIYDKVMAKKKVIDKVIDNINVTDIASETSDKSAFGDIIKALKTKYNK